MILRVEDPKKLIETIDKVFESHQYIPDVMIYYINLHGPDVDARWITPACEKKECSRLLINEACSIHLDARGYIATIRTERYSCILTLFSNALIRNSKTIYTDPEVTQLVGIS